MDFIREMVLDDLKKLQKQPLGVKIDYSTAKIREFVNLLGGVDHCYIAYDGSKESVVLKHLVLKAYPEMKVVFFDTGLYPKEIVDFIKNEKPKKTKIIKTSIDHEDIWKQHGLPVATRQYAHYINDVRDSNDSELVERRLNSGHMGALPKELLHFTDKSFFKYRVSDKCCQYYKTYIFNKFKELEGREPFVSTMAANSPTSTDSWIKYSCNKMTEKRNISRPLSIWLDSDIDTYIKNRKLDTNKIDKSLISYKGCIYCPIGAASQGNKKTKFDWLYHNEKPRYDALMKSGIKEVLLGMGVKITSDSAYMDEYQDYKDKVDEWYRQVESDIKGRKESSKFYKYHKYFE